ncbi:hypothetical protein CPB83DRAFT_840657 [Crepidotus variabilis]|uniref:Uncharacterized protein n=1 Tax=Crepidotus variabilis TaxID=179855 RepID=A0A9P6E483_9AGAR|nr:hypothetical protein CPB83DRAFT_840657 [Crepidotus variabilis]
MIIDIARNGRSSPHQPHTRSTSPSTSITASTRPPDKMQQGFIVSIAVCVLTDTKASATFFVGLAFYAIRTGERAGRFEMEDLGDESDDLEAPREDADGSQLTDEEAGRTTHTPAFRAKWRENSAQDLETEPLLARDEVVGLEAQEDRDKSQWVGKEPGHSTKARRKFEQMRSIWLQRLRTRQRIVRSIRHQLQIPRTIGLFSNLSNTTLNNTVANVEVQIPSWVFRILRSRPLRFSFFSFTSNIALNNVNMNVSFVGSAENGLNAA